MYKFNRKFHFLTGVSLMLLLGISFSCSKNSGTDPVPEPTPEPTPDPTYFEFPTVKDYNLTVNLNQGTTPVGLTRFDVYDENPIVVTDGIESFNKALNPIFTGITDAQGKYSDQMRIPAAISKLYLYVAKAGIPNLITANVSGGSVTFDVLTSTKSYGTKAQYTTINVANTYALADWDGTGKPSNIFARDAVPAALLQDINASLPEGTPLTITHPEYINPNAVSNLIIKDLCTIDIAFVHEGAGWLNVLGYYTYPTNNPPANLNNIRKNVVFPNVSFYNSGGGLYTGDRVHLKYWDGTAYTEVFPPGQTLGWFLFANGFNSSNKSVSQGNYMHSSDPQFNNETNVNLKQHTIFLYDATRNLMVLSFEDIRRDNSGCDQDFNDAIFYALPTPITAIETENISKIDRYKDTDGDGVGDDTDEYPNDPALAYRVYYPGKDKFGTLAFEDLWPSQGDYDMNDMVCDYNIIHYMNGANKVVKVDGTIKARASGAKYQNGFAIQLGVDPSSIQSLTVTGGSVSTIAVDGKGLEIGQSKANIIFFDDIYKLFGVASGSMLNTDMNQAKKDPKTITFAMQFTSPQSLSTLTAPPYNPYMIVQSGSGSRGKEVHLPGYKPTDKADASLFSTGQDLTNVSKNRYYVASNNMPFAILIPESFAYPVEKAGIGSAYTKFSSWATSFGTQYTDWYQNKTGYRNPALIYSK